MKRKINLHSRVLVAALVAISGAASAAPTVFISESTGLSWWNSPSAKGIVIGTSASGVPAADVTKFVGRTSQFDPYKICSLTEVGDDTYVGVDRTTQNDIAQTLKSVHWRLSGQTPNGRRVVAQSVLYQACDDEENHGAAVLVTDATTLEVLMFEPLGPGEGGPIWTAFLMKPDPAASDPPMFSFSSCTECGAAWGVYYDVTRKKIYTEYNGH